jgi:hypothetical protein
MIASCPADVQAAIERRCAAVRSGQLQPYGGMLRTNVLSVVKSVFPRFSARRGEKALAQDVDDFVRFFGAEHAQFMHISTEFVRFSDGRISDVVTRTLLEYEWALFSVEVSEARVVTSSRAALQQLSDVRLNPTLQLIAVPFDLNADDAEAERMIGENRPPFVYAVYRTADHYVVTKSLSVVDITYLQAMTGATQTTSDDHSAWIDDALRLGLVVAHPT